MSSDPSSLKNARTQRWLSVFLALAVFFLPLHFHVTSAIASQVTKECSCFHGNRTQLSLTAAPVIGAPVMAVCAVERDTQVEIESHSVRIPSSRAPPRPASF
jgi:hypothetical protein